MKKFVKILFLVLFCIANYNIILANTNTKIVRVGLEYKYKNVQSVSINNKEITFGYGVNGIYTHDTTLSSQQGFIMKVTNSYYVSIVTTYNTYEKALQKSNELNNLAIKANPASLGNALWTVYCGGYSSINEANSVAQKIGQGAKVINPNNKMTELISNNSTILICDNSNSYPRIGASKDNVVILSDRKYRGQIEFNRMSGSITAINILDVEDYLCGNVPSEIPARWHMEALKAQTVAARTYAYKTNKHSNQGYDLCDGVHCQAYIGYNNESESTNLAVKSTSGQRLYYNNELIDALYFSSSGGYTDNSENVWQGIIPYLRGVNDSYEKEHKTWSRTVTLNDLNKFLTDSHSNIGNAVDMKIKSHTEGGRVNELLIIGTLGTKILTKESIRIFFEPSLDSKMFEIFSNNSPIDDILSIKDVFSVINKHIGDIRIFQNNGILNQINSNNSIYVLNGSGKILPYAPKAQSIPIDTFIINGKGYGHGVGLSQYGAKGMAESGFSYIDILKHYYFGVNII